MNTVSIIIVVSWTGHHPAYAALLAAACSGFSEKVFIICPEGADPIARMAASGMSTREIRVLHFSNRYANGGFRKLSRLSQDLLELHLLVRSIFLRTPTCKLFVFHSDLNSLFWNTGHMIALVSKIRRVFPWNFAGFLVTPDRKWPFERVRGRLDHIFRHCAPPCRTILHEIGQRSLGMLGDLLRSAHLRLRNTLLRRSRCGAIALQDERYLASIAQGTSKLTEFFPETADVRESSSPPELVRLIRCQRGHSAVVGLVGALSPRKGISLLLETIRESDTRGLLFVIAGACHSGELTPGDWEFLVHADHTRNVIFSPKAIPTEEEFNSILNACDVIYCVYKAHMHSSNVLSKAAAFRKPVLVSAGELMAKRVGEYKLGTVLSESTVEACSNALRVMSRPEYLESFRRTGEFDRYLRDNSFAKLESVMRRLASLPCNFNLP